MIAFSQADHQRERYIYGGWNFADDDTPKPPELSPLDSAQSRRAARQNQAPPDHRVLDFQNCMGRSIAPSDFGGRPENC
jgi:hypothetical protein